jgi:hypothetical protein
MTVELYVDDGADDLGDASGRVGHGFLQIFFKRSVRRRST